MKSSIIQSLVIAGLFLSGFSMSAQKTPFYSKGYAGDVELGFLVKGYPYASLSTMHGFCFGKGWFLGIGGAFESSLYPRTMDKTAEPVPEEWHGEGFRETKYPYEGDMMVKVYLDIRKTFHVKDTPLFADLKFGFPFNLAEPLGFGLFVRPAVGMTFGRHCAVSAGADWSFCPYPDAGTDVIRPKQITLPYVGVSYMF